MRMKLEEKTVSSVYVQEYVALSQPLRMSKQQARILVAWSTNESYIFRQWM